MFKGRIRVGNYYKQGYESLFGLFLCKLNVQRKALVDAYACPRHFSIYFPPIPPPRVSITFPKSPLNSTSIPLSLHAFSPLSVSFLSIYFHYPFALPPQIQLGSLGDQTGPAQTHFDTSTGLKTHLMTASFSYSVPCPIFPMTQKLCHPPILRRPWTCVQLAAPSVSDTDRTCKYKSLSRSELAGEWQWRVETAEPITRDSRKSLNHAKK